MMELMTNITKGKGHADGPSSPREIMVLFVNTFRASYYEKLVGYTTKGFAELVIFYDMIESVEVGEG